KRVARPRRGTGLPQAAPRGTGNLETIAARGAARRQPRGAGGSETYRGGGRLSSAGTRLRQRADAAFPRTGRAALEEASSGPPVARGSRIGVRTAPPRGGGRAGERPAGAEPRPPARPRPRPRPPPGRRRPTRPATA